MPENGGMRADARPRRLPAWHRWAARLALAALFGVALAPSISRWLVAGTPAGDGPLAALCTAGHPDDTPAGGTALHAACPLCLLAAAAPLVTARAPDLPGVAEYRPVLASPDPALPAFARARPAALARAPPARA